MTGRDLRALRVSKGVNQGDVTLALRWRSWKLGAIENEKLLPLPEDEKLLIETIEKLAKQKEAAPA